MLKNRLYGPAAFYLGWYWAVALAGAYAAVTLLTCAALEMPGVPIIGWPPFFSGLGYATRLVILVLPATVLIAEGLAFRRRGRRGWTWPLPA